MKTLRTDILLTYAGAQATESNQIAFGFLYRNWDKRFELNRLEGISCFTHELKPDEFLALKEIIEDCLLDSYYEFQANYLQRHNSLLTPFDYGFDLAEEWKLVSAENLCDFLKTYDTELEDITYYCDEDKNYYLLYIE